MICMKEKHSKIEAYLKEQAVMDKNGKQETWWVSPLYKSHKAAKIAAEYGNPLCPGSILRFCYDRKKQRSNLRPRWIQRDCRVWVKSL